jgi:alkanesulfonate monooxygenase SsuD/methylene tetrahydromethanopterin reductase-like flavin-dependent oxidoreductase (luciferase family)
MRYPLRFHVLLLPNVGWAELKARVVRLESLGFEVAALADHFVDWTTPAVPWFESWTALAALADATRTIRLSTVVTQIPLRNPAMLARQALTLDHISGGRIELGLGTGITIDPSYAMAGLPNWEPAERVERFAEYVDLVARLLSQEVTTFQGRYYQVDGAIMNPRPVQSPRPPILIAALAPRMLRHAARYADIWNSLSFLLSFDDQLAETRARVEAIDAACAAIAREPSTLRRSYTMFDARARPRGGTIGYYESAERFIDQVSRVAELGISDVGLYYPLDPAQLSSFERIATDVLPRLRATYPAI